MRATVKILWYILGFCVSEVRETLSDRVNNAENQVSALEAGVPCNALWLLKPVVNELRCGLSVSAVAFFLRDDFWLHHTSLSTHSCYPAVSD